ncbi:hypothetical protein PR048_001834 [Dryococelus australis]|uniref:Uncharacterized protein n=1 Tax=Dryococelus australis TaxID=614101 RepID=A0ABQ9IIF9_9NEOP|nr:hypothetical protein PR048_001834 [Dryococelus australis]
MNFIWFASDRANVMMGKNHSLRSLLVQDIPNVFIMKNDLLIAGNILTKLNDPVTNFFFNFWISSFHSLKTSLKKCKQSPKICGLHKKISMVLKSIFEYFFDRSCLRNTPIENIDFQNPRNFVRI